MSSRKKLKMVALDAQVAAGEPAGAGPASAGSLAARARPDPEVRALAKRRKFDAAYKLAVLGEADRLTGSGEIGALLRREALYSSQLTSWRREREAGALEALGRRRGRKARSSPEQKRVAALEARNARLARAASEPALADPAPAASPAATSASNATIFSFFLDDIAGLPFDSNSTKVGVSPYIGTNGIDLGLLCP